MIAKCVALLAIVAQINGYVVKSHCANSVVGATGNTRNIIAKGKYPVALDNCGPVPDPRVPITTSHVQAPVQEKPIVRLAASIPAPRTVAHSCTCYKTILRPRVHDQVISVPSIHRYIETTHTPVVENIHYEAVPVNSPDSYASGLAYRAGGLGVGSLATGYGIAPVASTGCSSPCINGYYY